MRNKPRVRNLFTTRTMQGAYYLIAGFFIDNNDAIVSFIDNNYPGIDGRNIKFYLSLIVYICGLIRIATGRYLATKDVFTPTYMPGRSKQQAIANVREI